MIISNFDPWKSKLCTCPLKYSFSPYVGCSHGCLYCYASSYIKNFNKPRAKKNVIRKLKEEIKKIKDKRYVSIANSSDPYQELEKKLKLTRESIKIFLKNNFKILILTKSDLILRDLDILKNSSVVVSITITTLENWKAKKLEPNAPSPEKRIETLRILSENNIPTVVRIDPIIPLINDCEIEEIVKTVAENGAKHIVSSTYKVKKDNWERMKNEFPEEMKKLEHFYFSRGEKIHGYLYLPKNIRYNLMRRVFEEAKKYGLSFSVCREGFFELNTSICDGSHLFK